MTDVATLLITDTAAAVLAKGLAIAEGLGLPVTTWRTGDPTKSLYSFLARILAGDDSDPSEKGLSGIIQGYGQSAVLSLATRNWLTVLAKEVYGVDRVLATPATSTVTLHNVFGGLYVLDPGDVTVQCSSSGATYHTTSGGTLSAGVTLSFSVVADLDGSDGSAPTDGIDTLVTSLIGVVVTASTAAIGVDEQSDPELRAQCRATLGALSPNGPADAYEFVARNPLLTGVTDITRARAIDFGGGDGTVFIYLASATGLVAPASSLAAQSAIDIWATPLAVTAFVEDASLQIVNVTATITGTGIPADFQARIAAALGTAIAEFDIAGLAGDVIDTTLLTAIMRSTIPQIRTINMTVPAAPVTLVAADAPIIGVVTITEV